MDLTRRSLMISTAAALNFGSSDPALAAASMKVDPRLLQAILDAGSWSETADDRGGSERLPEDVATELAGTGGHPPSPGILARLGLLVLTVSVAEWGVDWKRPATPRDPANRQWKGPATIKQGKHLMSYALGGIGLPHLDTGDAVKFYEELVRLLPQARPDLASVGALSSDFNYDRVRAAGGVCAPNPKAAAVMTDIDGTQFQHDASTLGGEPYCSEHDPSGRLDTEAWQKLRHWSRIALRRRDMQAWVLQYWLDHVWAEAYSTVVATPHGSLREALAVARIWSSSRGDALRALRAAGQEPDTGKRLSAELETYSHDPRTGKVDDVHAARTGIMQRPWAIVDLISAR